jgi:hypothetical protein
MLKAVILARQNGAVNPSLEILPKQLFVVKSQKPSLRIVQEFLKLKVSDWITHITAAADKAVCDFVGGNGV